MTEMIIRKPKLTSIQTRWIALHWDGVRYSTAKFRYEAGKRSKLSIDAYGVSSMLFEHLNDITSNGESWWVCGWNMYEALCKCGMYMAIKAGMLRLTRNQQSNVGESAQYSRKGLHGCLICENPPTIIDCQLQNGARIKFLDPRNWGVEKEMIVDECEEDGIDDAVQAIEDYVSLVVQLEMGQLKHTAASQGYYCYRLKHMHYDIISDNEPCARMLERDSYYAGRCEAFQIGKTGRQTVHVDVTSMYSSFGFDRHFPTRLVAVHAKPSLKMIDMHDDSKSYIARCTVKTRSPFLPLRIDKRVIFPVGEFVTTLAWPEFKSALLAGAVCKIHLMAEYEAKVIFDTYAKWYSEALANLPSLGLGHMRNALKFAVNSSYGKFAARSRDWIDKPDDHACYEFDQWWGRHPKSGNVVQWRSIEGNVQYLDLGNDSTACCPAISATMASYGREYVWRLMLCAGQGSVFYLDTDGLMVTEAAYCRLFDAGHVGKGEFGKLRTREHSCNVDIIGLKHYKFGDRYVCAGVPIQGMIVHSDHTEYNRHVPFDYAMWHDKPFDHKYDRMTRQHKQRYRHGHVLDDGKVIPFEIGATKSEYITATGRTAVAVDYSIMGGARSYAWKSDTTTAVRVHDA